MRALRFFAASLALSALACDAPPADPDDAGTPPPPGDAAPPGHDAGPPPDLEGPVDRARVFLIGHSLINHHMPAMLHALAQAAGLDYDFQTQIINGAPLRWNWDHSASGEGRHARPGDARAELPSGRFDVVVMTEGIPLDADTVRAGGNFYQLAVQSNPSTRTFLFETWHAHEWDELYAVYNMYEPDPALHLPGRGAYEWRAVLDDMRPAWIARVDGINAAHPGHVPMHVVPGGPAMGRLVDEIEAGRVPGLGSRRDLFSDEIHLNDLGNYFVALVHFSAIFRRSPEGLTPDLRDEWGGRYARPTEAQEAIFQRVAWEHVSRDPRAGVRRAD
ncbi:MAG: hypothetical protein KF729_19200 [Sandaracinaceae bacterium]|nr:hypothetical protein [Sandaracinaceae bacterium]